MTTTPEAELGFDVTLILIPAGGSPLRKEIRLPFPPMPGLNLAVGTDEAPWEIDCRDVSYDLASRAFAVWGRCQDEDVDHLKKAGFRDAPEVVGGTPDSRLARAGLPRDSEILPHKHRQPKQH